MISYSDYEFRKKKFEEEGRDTYLAGDLNKFTSQTSEYMAFVNNYINQLTTDDR